MLQNKFFHLNLAVVGAMILGFSLVAVAGFYLQASAPYPLNLPNNNRTGDMVHVNWSPLVYLGIIGVVLNLVQLGLWLWLHYQKNKQTTAPTVVTPLQRQQSQPLVDTNIKLDELAQK